MDKKKYIKTIFLSFFAALLIGKISVPVAYAEEGKGWVEVQVSVPENFNDQIYIQFQEEGKIDEAFYGNFVQVLPENNYIGRIQLPVGAYEITCMNTYENPLIYNVEVASDTEYPVVVTSDTTATLVKFNCTPVPIEDLPEIEGEYPQDILDAAQKASDEKAKANQESTISDTDIEEGDYEQPEEDDKANENNGPIYSILRGLLSTAAFILIIGLASWFYFKLKGEE